MFQNRATSSAYARKAYLLSHAEQRLFATLDSIVRPFGRLMSKVRLADVVSCEGSPTLNGDFGRISQKHLDFVLIDPATSKILIAIELDDRSHLTRHTRSRDAFVNNLLNAIGLPLVRIQAAAEYNPYVLKQLIAVALSAVQSDRPLSTRKPPVRRRPRSRRSSASA